MAGRGQSGGEPTPLVETQTLKKLVAQHAVDANH
jgi:hypothetical protein